ncbi:protein kinase domain-containing protein [Streptomyces sp. NPDC054784]
MVLGTLVEGRYQLTKGPVVGGAGEVWLAFDTALRRGVVLKRASPGRGGNTAAFDRLRAEARALGRCNHPHVVTLHEIVPVEGRPGDTTWLVMEYVSGGSLDGWPPVSPAIAARVGAQLAGALAALHAEGLVHCDIKPANVVFTEHGAAKLADFGAAYRVGGKETLTPNGAVSYTPEYAAREAVSGRPGTASDVFSLAATVHALATGHPPRRCHVRAAAVRAEDPVRAEGAGQAEDPGLALQPDPHRDAARGIVELGPGLGPLADVLRAMLARDPGARPDAATARDLLEAVAAPPDELAALTPPASAWDTAPAFDPASFGDRVRAAGGSAVVRAGGALRGGERAGRRRRWLLAGTAAVLLVLLTGWLVPLPFPGGGDGDGRDDGKQPPPSGQAGNHGPLLGTHRTADPCALLEPSDLGRFGDTELDRDYGNFDRCDVLVTPDDGGEVDVTVDLEGGPPPELAAADRTEGPVSVVEEAPEGDSCFRLLLLAGEEDAFVAVGAKETEPGDAPLCEMADVAVDRAVEVLGDGPLPRRSPPLADASLGQRDVCALFRPRTLEIVPGVDAGDPDIGFGRWDCDWESTTSDLHLDVRFDRGPPLGAEDGTPDRFGGYRAFVEPEGEDDDSCLVRVVYRTYADQGGRSAVEVLHLVLGGSRPMGELCRMGGDLARGAAAELRSPS